MTKLKELLPGISIALTVSVVSFLAALAHPSLDSLVLSTIFGLLVANMIGDRETFEQGVSATLKVALPLGIGLYGAQLDFGHRSASFWWGTLGVFGLTLAVTYVVCKGFGLGRMLSMLLSAGLAICGASALAVLGPLLGAKKDEMATSIIALVLVGLTGMIMFRLAPDFMGLPERGFAFLVGASLPMLGQVKVSAMEMDHAGRALALDYKLMRVAMLAPVALGAIIYSRAAGKQSDKPSLPWFMAFFFLLAGLANFHLLPGDLLWGAEVLSRFFLTVTLCCLGLSLDFDSITSRGAGPLFAASLAWSIVVLSAYLAISMLV